MVSVVTDHIYFCYCFYKDSLIARMLESLNKKYSIAAINIYGTFLLSCIMCYLVSYLDKNRLSSFNNTPIYIAFQNPTFINLIT